MSGPENFLARWSRRKRDAAEDTSATKPDTAPDASAETTQAREDPRPDGAALAEPGGELPELSFDPASLPPIESITAESDIRAFLAPGVPAELTRAALRRVWTTDPNIRDFIGLSENSWDFNAAGSIGGFGPLEMTDELRRQIAQMVGRGLAAEATERAAPTPSKPSGGQAPAEGSMESVATTVAMPTQPPQSNVGTCEDQAGGSNVELHNCDRVTPLDKDNVATQHPAKTRDNVELVTKRPHGRALPK